LKEKLTFHRRSQSKLSQQELSELQKATHFDKKELQQWYKGEFGNECWRTKCKGIRNLTDFQVS
jgi:hypothetical protein